MSRCKFAPKPRTTKLADATAAKLLAIRHLRPVAISITTKRAILAQQPKEAP
jgi:hypothetical protein